jgi:hypothetical protein
LKKVRLIMDNLNTHNIASLYETYEPQEAQRSASRLEIHHTPNRIAATFAGGILHNPSGQGKKRRETTTQQPPLGVKRKPDPARLARRQRPLFRRSCGTH